MSGGRRRGLAAGALPTSLVVARVARFERLDLGHAGEHVGDVVEPVAQAALHERIDVEAMHGAVGRDDGLRRKVDRDPRAGMRAQVRDIAATTLSGSATGSRPFRCGRTA